MIYERTTHISNLKIALKDLERCVKNPQLLRTGRKLENFDLLPREAWASWLICVVERSEGSNWTFSEDPSGGDGRLLDLDTMNAVPMEHVFIPPPSKNEKRTVTEQMVSAIEKKAKKGGAAYAKGKVLVIFSEAVGIFKPNILARTIFKKHDFEIIYVVGLEKSDDKTYEYWVTQLHPFPLIDSPAWKISIEINFDKWHIKRVQ